MQYLGKFQRYQPSPDDKKNDVLFLKNEKEEDWYDLVKKKQKEKALFCVTDEKGEIIHTHADISRLFPENQSVWQVAPEEKTEKRYILNDTLQDMPLALYLERAARNIQKEHAAFVRDMSGNASPEERDTWTVKYLAAQSVMEKTALKPQTEMLQEEAEQAGQTVQELAKIILAKAERYQTLIGRAAGMKQKYLAKLTLCENLQQAKQVMQDFQAETERARQA